MVNRPRRPSRVPIFSKSRACLAGGGSTLVRPMAMVINRGLIASPATSGRVSFTARVDREKTSAAKTAAEEVRGEEHGATQPSQPAPKRLGSSWAHSLFGASIGREGMALHGESVREGIAQHGKSVREGLVEGMAQHGESTCKGMLFLSGALVLSAIIMSRRSSLNVAPGACVGRGAQSCE